MRKLDGQVALVTGASSGIGHACALALAREGAAVAISYSSHPEPAEQLAAAITAEGGRAVALGADVTQEAEITALFAGTLDHFGALDILIANAGLQRDAPAEQMSLAAWNQVITTNLTGQFLCAREAIRAFLRQGNRGVSRATGKIVCMSSVHEVIPWGGHVNYAASKGGIMLMMKTLAQEFAGRGIRVNGIAPGAISTPINAAARAGDGEAKMLKLIPYGRVGTPEDVARAATWLVSDEADYVVGTTLFVDGGMALYPGFQDNG